MVLPSCSLARLGPPCSAGLRTSVKSGRHGGHDARVCPCKESVGRVWPPWRPARVGRRLRWASTRRRRTVCAHGRRAAAAKTTSMCGPPISIKVVSDVTPPNLTSQIKVDSHGMVVVNVDQSPLVLAPPLTFSHHQHTSSGANIGHPAPAERTRDPGPVPVGLPVPLPVRTCSVPSEIPARSMPLPVIEHDEIPAMPMFHTRCPQPVTAK